MSADSTTQLQAIIDRMAPGDRAAINELIERAYPRLQCLARNMLKGFPHVHSFEETDDVLHNSLRRLMQALQEKQPTSVAKFFGLAWRQMHWSCSTSRNAIPASEVPSANPRRSPMTRVRQQLLRRTGRSVPTTRHPSLNGRNSTPRSRNC